MILEFDIILWIGLSKRKERKKSTGTWDVFLILQTLLGFGVWQRNLSFFLEPLFPNTYLIGLQYSRYIFLLKSSILYTKYHPLLFHKMWSHMGVPYFYVCNCKFFKLHLVSWSSNFMNIHWLLVFALPSCYEKCEPESHSCSNQ